MNGLWPLIFGGLVMIAGGLRQLFAPIDVIWARQERYLLSRGQSPQRGEVWESSARNRGIFAVVVGLIILLLPFMIRASVPPKMSGVSINGHELTQQEWDGCGHDMPTCLSTYYNR